MRKSKRIFEIISGDIIFAVFSVMILYTAIISVTLFASGEEIHNIPDTEADIYADRENHSEPELAVMLSSVELPEEKDIPEAETLFNSQQLVTGCDTLTLFDTDTGKCEQISLEEYTVGSLLAEMPTSYEKEALKAQAVACRTYAVYKMTNGTFHQNGADLCTSPAHCQAFASKKSVSDERYATAKNAVDETAGVIMLYEGSPVLAVFHSSSGAFTKSSEEVWGGERPYLCSVPTWETENPDMQVKKTYSFSPAEFLKRFNGVADAQMTENDFCAMTVHKTESGKVTCVSAGNADCNVSDFVSAFGLRSSDFDIYTSDGNVDIITNGYGHGVGMSQYGAQDLAQKGYAYDKILTHYYKGITFGYTA